jgi:hypothetical protein
MYRIRLRDTAVIDPVAACRTTAPPAPHWPVKGDTTNTYFERDEPDEGDAPFRAYGKSKDHRDDLPQITIGLAVTKEGVPVRCWCWPGGTSDQAILPQVKDDMRDWKLGRVMTVVDRGFSSADNLSYLTRAGGHYIAGMRMRDGGDLAEAALARQGRYQSVNPLETWRTSLCCSVLLMRA